MKTRAQDIEKLWRRYLKTRKVEHRNLLIEHYASLVQIQAARLSRKLPAQVTYDELTSAGYDGLLEAVEAYDPGKKAKFETFCQQRIIGAVMDWLRTLDAQSRTVRNFEKRCYRLRERLEAELGRPPNQEELAAAMGLSMERFNELARISQVGREVHFSAMDAQTGARSSQSINERPWDVGDPRTDDPSAKTARTMLTDLLTRGLSREERLVLLLYYYESLTMAEIGAVLDLSESRVSQIHKDVLRRLRKRYRDVLEQEQLVA